MNIPKGQISPQSPEAGLAGALAAAQAGDSGAFSSLTEPHRGELLAHCYRMTGSLEDAEDLVQETFLRAWRRLETYQGRASLRAWLYKIATNACLDALKRRPKRSLPTQVCDPSDPSAPLGLPTTEPMWIQPYPDELLAPSEANPEARYEARESISLAFLVALQELSPRQRFALISGDVLDWQPTEIADTLETTISAVNSLLHRARSTLKQRYSTGRRVPRDPTLSDKKLKDLLDRYLRAWETADVESIISMLREDATFPMPPLPVWFQGRTAIKSFISGTILAGEGRGRWRLLPVHANGQPGFAFYQRDEKNRRYFPFAIQVLTFDGDLLSDVSTFGYPALFPAFNLPAELGE
jgi:RNA polymerase sigma-70 factor (ECF subfamily)